MTKRERVDGEGRTSGFFERPIQRCRNCILDAGFEFRKYPLPVGLPERDRPHGSRYEIGGKRMQVRRQCTGKRNIRDRGSTGHRDGIGRPYAGLCKYATPAGDLNRPGIADRPEEALALLGRLERKLAGPPHCRCQLRNFEKTRAIAIRNRAVYLAKKDCISTRTAMNEKARDPVRERSPVPRDPFFDCGLQPMAVGKGAHWKRW